MTGEKVEFDQAPTDKQQAEQRRERSTIQFPYGDLEDAENIAASIHENAGEKCTVQQLAAYVNQSPTSGTFRLRLSTASTFGLTENQRGEVALTELGRRILDPAQKKKARVEAFLRVPLYEAIFNKYNGYMLPPIKALEREMNALGVSSKQTDKARQAFERSAQRAGFFAHGNDRLTMPAKLEVHTPQTIKLDKGESPKSAGGGGDGGEGKLHPLIEGLIKALPDPDSEWPVERRVKWLQAAAYNFDLVYCREDNETGEISVSLIR